MEADMDGKLNGKCGQPKSRGHWKIRQKTYGIWAQITHQKTESVTLTSKNGFDKSGCM